MSIIPYSVAKEVRDLRFDEHDKYPVPSVTVA